MAGRKPKPTVLHVLNGNPSKIDLKKRAEKEPKPDKAKLACPSYMRSDRIASAEWRRIVPELYRLGLLTKVDRAALELYCSQYAIYRRALRSINEEGLITTNIRNGDKANPAAAIAREAAKIIKAMAAEFGLTPSSRGRMSLPSEAKKEDPMEELLKSRGI